VTLLSIVTRFGNREEARSLFPKKDSVESFELTLKFGVKAIAIDSVYGYILDS